SPRLSDATPRTCPIIDRTLVRSDTTIRSEASHGIGRRGSAQARRDDPASQGVAELAGGTPRGPRARGGDDRDRTTATGGRVPGLAGVAGNVDAVCAARSSAHARRGGRG